jgi:phospholipid/cholesterol/gamma-HCH transport system substrate-binding protein
MQNKLLDFWVGLFVLAGLAALAVLTFQVGNFSSQSKEGSYSVVAHFENIGGLTDKSPVRMAGVNIGRVASIDLDADDYSAKVTMSIDAKHSNLPLDTSAAILTSGLIGANYVGLEPGGDFDYLTDGDQIEITQSAVVLENLIGRFLYNSAGSEDSGDTSQ